jgi:amino acid transporter
MALNHDIEMNRLDRARSPGEGSTFTTPGRSYASVSDAGRPGSSRTRPLPLGSRHRGGITTKDRITRFIDSFRREEGTSNNSFAFHVTDADADHDGEDGGFAPPRRPSDVAVVREHQGGRYYDLRSANAKTASTLLARELKGRHLQMIAISGSIGTGLFVASGKALSQGGPASVLLAYLIVGVMLWCTVQALGEMAVVFPVAGSFSAFSTRFLDPSWGFAMGWK